jgi:transposase
LTQKPTQPREAYHSLEFFKLNADAAGIKRLLELKPDVALMEPTGVNYQRLWGIQLAKVGVEVRLVSNNKLPSYRKTLDLPDKDDDADALALACYYFDYQHLPRRFLQVRDSVTVRVRELCLRLVALQPRAVAYHQSPATRFSLAVSGSHEREIRDRSG